MATELAQAYVQIMPSAKGIHGSLSSLLGGEASAAGESAGRSMGGKLVGAALGIISAAAIGQAFAAAISEGAALEQSLGGIETLFKESADTVKQNAAEAYRTAGMSANQYMELTTSFAASLLQSLGGDTEAAARISDMAMTDMSDNANKMGTDMERITDAYQGFAKQNYTMLDNLKLGYGGTKEEMQRLLADAQKITGVKYDIGNLSDVYEAIHVIQGELDITGTTAKEAAATLSGSLASMKASFKNVLAQLTLGQDVGPALNALAETTTTFLVGNLLPAVWNILKALPGALVTFVKAAVPQMSAAFLDFFPQIQEGIAAAVPTLLSMAQTLVDRLCSGFAAAYPALLTRGGEILRQLIAGATAALPELFQAALNIITSFVNTFISNYPTYIRTGTQVLLSLIEGLRQALPQMLTAAGQAVLSMASGLLANLPQIIDAGFDMIAALIEGIGDALPDILAAAGQVVSMIWNWIQNTDWLSLGKSILSSFVSGMLSVAGALFDAIDTLTGGAATAIVNFFTVTIPQTVQNALTFLQGVPASIAAFFRQLPYNIGFFLGQAMGTLANWALQLPLLAAQAASTFLTNFVTFFSQLPGNILQWLNSALANVTQWAIQLGQKGLEAARTMVSNVVITIQELPGKLMSIGRQAVEGLWNGINAAKDWLIGKIQSFVSGIVDGFVNAFKIGSPSRVMEDEVGWWLTPGIAKGFLGNIGVLKTAMGKVRDYLTGQMDSIQDRLSRALYVSQSAPKTEIGRSGGFVQNIYFEQPMQAPDEIARTLRIQNTTGLAGAR